MSQLVSEYTIWDNRELINYVSHRNAGDQSFAGVVGKRMAPTFKELAVSNGAYTGSDMVWWIPACLLGTTAKPADRIIDADAVAWTALEVRKIVLGSVWRIMSRNLVLAHDLRDTISIERATFTTDAMGGDVRSWPPGSGTTPYANIAAKVQKITDDLRIVLGIQGFEGTYAVIIDRDVTLGPNDRVKFGTAPPVYLDILGLKNPTRIDELPVLDCRIHP